MNKVVNPKLMLTQKLKKLENYNFHKRSVSVLQPVSKQEIKQKENVKNLLVEFVKK